MKRLALPLLVLLCACTRTTTYVDRTADKNNSFQVTTKFYEALKEKKMDKITPLLNLSANANEAKEQESKLYANLLASAEKNGDVESYEVVSNKTRVVEAAQSKTGQYEVLVKLKRSKQATTFEDKFILVLLNNHIKINNYTTNAL